MKVIRLSLLFVAACCAGLAPLASAQQQTVTTSPTPAAAGSVIVSPATTPQPNGFVAPADADDGKKALEQAPIQKYLLGPGDLLDLRVFNEPQFSDKLQVTDEGFVEVPFIGPILARCRTDVEIRKDVTTALSKYLRSPQVSLRISETRSRPAAVVFGAVRSPQRVDMRRRVRLLDLLAASGGATEQAGGDIQIFHTEAVMCPEQEVELAAASEVNDTTTITGSYKLFKLTDLKVGKVEANPFIRPGDIVIVTEAPPIYVTGAVIQPQGIYLREKMQLTRAIAMVGGTKKDAKLNSIKIYRLKPNSNEQEMVTVDFEAIRKQKQPDIYLQPFDVIEVPDPSGIKYTAKQLLFGGALGSVGSAMTNLPLRVLY